MFHQNVVTGVCKHQMLLLFLKSEILFNMEYISSILSFFFITPSLLLQLKYSSKTKHHQNMFRLKNSDASSLDNISASTQSIGFPLIRKNEIWSVNSINNKQDLSSTQIPHTKVGMQRETTNSIQPRLLSASLLPTVNQTIPIPKNPKFSFDTNSLKCQIEPVALLGTLRRITEVSDFQAVSDKDLISSEIGSKNKIITASPKLTKKSKVI